MVDLDDREAPVHPDAEPLAFLLGTWRGTGTVWFHSIGPTDFREVIRFGHRGRPWLIYDQRSWSVVEDQPLHNEMGFWRMVAEDRVNVFVALTAGTELSEGTVEGTKLELRASAAPMADGIETVTILERNYEVTDGVLEYEVWLGTDAQPHQRHVEAKLARA